MDGRCECGQVAYRLTASPIYVNCCHCGMCRRSSGSAFAINAMIEASELELTGSSAPEEVVTPSGSKSARCPNCHVELWTFHRMFGDALPFIRAGTLDEPVAPDAHFFVSQRHPWVTIPADVPVYDELPGEGEDAWSPDVHARVNAAMAAPLAGSEQPG